MFQDISKIFPDVLIVILIIVASYLFKVSELQKLDTQLMFVLLVLLVLIIYKIMHYRKLHRVESFQNETQNSTEVIDDITKWTTRTMEKEAQLSEEERKQLIDELSTFKNDVLQQNKALKNALNQVLSDKEERKYNTLDTMDLTNTQTLQNQQIKMLENKYEKARELLSLAEMEKTAKKYPKIPVYSSCVVADADGGYTLDTPNTNTAVKKMVTKNAVNAPTSSVSTVSPSSNTMQTSVSSSSSDVSNVLVNYLNNLSKEGINVNIS